MQRVERIYYHYTIAALEDELTFLLSSKNECDITLDENGQWYIHPFHPYLNQAEGLIYKINIYDPLPEFIIFTEDIPLDFVQELKSLGNIMMKKVITNAVRRIYESVDPEYYHTNGLYGKVRWRLAD